MEKVALVTGASRGIGQAIAERLARANLWVLGTATTPEGADKITQTFKEKGLKGVGVTLNMVNHAEVDRILPELMQQYGPVQILVNNAGITRDGLLLRMKWEDWQAVIDTNLSSIFYLTQACIKEMMKTRWGRIVNISSVAGVIGNPGQANYSAAKAGLLGLTKTLALEFVSRGITVNAVAPGFIDTQMTQKLTEAQRNAILQTVPMHRAGTPDDIAAAVAFLVSEEANYITGQTVHVNGGMYMV